MAWHAWEYLIYRHTKKISGLVYVAVQHKTHVVLDLIVQTTEEPVAQRTECYITASHHLDLIKLHGLRLLLRDHRHAVMVQGKHECQQVAGCRLADHKEQHHIGDAADPGHSGKREQGPVQTDTQTLIPAKPRRLVQSSLIEKVNHGLQCPRNTCEGENKEEVACLVRQDAFCKESRQRAWLILERSIIVGRRILIPKQNRGRVDIGIMAMDVCTCVMRVVLVFPPNPNGV